MKRLFFIILISVLVAACGDANSNYVRKAVRIMDLNGIYALGDEWEKAKAEALAARPASIEEAQEIVAKAGKIAGGKHTFLLTADDIQENAEAEKELPTVETMDSGITLIRLPLFSGNAQEGVEYALTVLDAIPDNPQGVIIDLRGNRGGNMYPMIAAVHPFLPDDTILKFRTRKRTMMIDVDYAIATASIERRPHIDCPVALLTDDFTGSSGEAVLLCFRGLDNARTFGSATAGYASSNQPFNLPGGSQLVLTIGEDVARTGEAFCDDPIEPDVPTATPLEDACGWIFSLN